MDCFINMKTFPQIFSVLYKWITLKSVFSETITSQWRLHQLKYIEFIISWFPIWQVWLRYVLLQSYLAASTLFHLSSLDPVNLNKPPLNRINTISLCDSVCLFKQTFKTSMVIEQFFNVQKWRTCFVGSRCAFICYSVLFHPFDDQF